MMTLNEQLLEFVEGGLAPEEEAELLHRLSVSPERRAVLRSFLNQKALFLKDRLSMQVPYAAEQKLWSELSMLMPAAVTSSVATAGSVATGSAIGGVSGFLAQTAGFFGRFFTSTAATLATSTLLVGLGVGYFVGSSSQTSNQTSNFASSLETGSKPVVSSGSISGNAVTELQNQSNEGNHHTAYSRREANRVSYIQPVMGALVPSWALTLPEANKPAVEVTTPSNSLPDQFASKISSVGVSGPLAEVSQPAKVGDGIRPVFSPSYDPHFVNRSLLERFEFSFAESFGRQFPNSTATNVSLPLITNSAISAYFQILPNTTALWVGASAGTANITHKKLSTRSGNPLDPLQQVLVADYVHVQANWAGGFLQYRLPINALADLLFEGGYGISSEGNLFMGEIGFHYDATRDVGFLVGLRGTEMTYDLTKDYQDALRSGNGSLVVPNGALDAPPSFNLELNAGLYFHF